MVLNNYYASLEEIARELARVHGTAQLIMVKIFRMRRIPPRGIKKI